jgi:hypothetical protein
MKWAKFTYVGTETWFVTKVSNSTNVKVTFATDNTLRDSCQHSTSKFKIITKNVIYTS